MTDRRQLPSSIEAEKALLGTLLLEPKSMRHVAGRIRQDDFYHPRLGSIYGIIEDIHSRGEPVDATLVISRAPDDLVGLIAEVSGGVPMLGHAQQYVDIIVECSSKRAMISACSEIISECYDRSTMGDTGYLINAINKLRQCHRDKLETVRMSELVVDIMRECEERYSDPETAKPLGVSTGLPGLDAQLVFEGLPRGLLTTVAAETSKGKSALAQQFCRAAAINGHRVLHVSIEDRALAVTARGLSAISGIPNRQLQRRIIGASEWGSLTMAAADASRWGSRIEFIDRRPANVDELISTADRIIDERGADLVVFDYLQLVPSGQKYSSRQDHVDYTFGAIERFSGSHRNTATVLISQMARHEGRPKLKKLYHSAMLEQGSHTVILIWDAPVAQETEAICRALDIAKQKDGPIGFVIVGWDETTVRFYDPDPYVARYYRDALWKIKE